MLLDLFNVGRDYNSCYKKHRRNKCKDSCYDYDSCYNNYCCYKCNSCYDSCYPHYHSSCDHHTSIGSSCGHSSIGSSRGHSSIGSSCGHSSIGSSCGHSSIGSSCGHSSIGSSCGHSSIGSSCGHSSHHHSSHHHSSCHKYVDEMESVTFFTNSRKLSCILMNMKDDNIEIEGFMIQGGHKCNQNAVKLVPSEEKNNMCKTISILERYNINYDISKIYRINILKKPELLSQMYYKLTRIGDVSSMFMGKENNMFIETTCTKREILRAMNDNDTIFDTPLQPSCPIQ